MVKGITQLDRNNAWHIKHLKKLKKQKISHKYRLFNYSHGITQTMRNKKRMMEIMDKQRERDIKSGKLKIKPSFFNRLFNFRRQTYA